MITGTVNTDHEAIICLSILSPHGLEREIETIIDTGFSGFLTLPPALIAELGLPFRRQGRAFLADGSEILFDIHEAAVVWDARQRRVPVDAAETDPLIGMTLLQGYELTVQVAVGGSVRIQALP